MYVYEMKQYHESGQRVCAKKRSHEAVSTTNSCVTEPPEPNVPPEKQPKLEGKIIVLPHGFTDKVGTVIYRGNYGHKETSPFRVIHSKDQHISFGEASATHAEARSSDCVMEEEGSCDISCKAADVLPPCPVSSDTGKPDICETNECSNGLTEMLDKSVHFGNFNAVRQSRLVTSITRAKCPDEPETDDEPCSVKVTPLESQPDRENEGHENEEESGEGETKAVKCISKKPRRSNSSRRVHLDSSSAENISEILLSLHNQDTSLCPTLNEEPTDESHLVSNHVMVSSSNVKNTPDEDGRCSDFTSVASDSDETDPHMLHTVTDSGRTASGLDRCTDGQPRTRSRSDSGSIEAISAILLELHNQNTARVHACHSSSEAQSFRDKCYVPENTHGVDEAGLPNSTNCDTIISPANSQHCSNLKQLDQPWTGLSHEKQTLANTVIPDECQNQMIEAANSLLFLSTLRANSPINPENNEVCKVTSHVNSSPSLIPAQIENENKYILSDNHPVVPVDKCRRNMTKGKKTKKSQKTEKKVRTPDTVKCPLCDFAMGPGCIEEHKKQHRYLSITCSACQILYENKKAYKKHLKASHFNELFGRTKLSSKVREEFKCTICGGIFASQEILKKHMNSTCKRLKTSPMDKGRLKQNEEGRLNSVQKRKFGMKSTQKHTKGESFEWKSCTKSEARNSQTADERIPPSQCKHDTVDHHSKWTGRIDIKEAAEINGNLGGDISSDVPTDLPDYVSVVPKFTSDPSLWNQDLVIGSGSCEANVAAIQPVAGPMGELFGVENSLQRLNSNDSQQDTDDCQNSGVSATPKIKSAAIGAPSSDKLEKSVCVDAHTARASTKVQHSVPSDEDASLNTSQESSCTDKTAALVELETSGQPNDEVHARPRTSQASTQDDVETDTLATADEEIHSSVNRCQEVVYSDSSTAAVTNLSASGIKMTTPVTDLLQLVMKAVEAGSSDFRESVHGFVDDQHHCSPCQLSFDTLEGLNHHLEHIHLTNTEESLPSEGKAANNEQKIPKKVVTIRKIKPNERKVIYVTQKGNMPVIREIYEESLECSKSAGVVRDQLSSSSTRDAVGNYQSGLSKLAQLLPEGSKQVNSPSSPAAGGSFSVICDEHSSDDILRTVNFPIGKEGVSGHLSRRNAISLATRLGSTDIGTVRVIRARKGTCITSDILAGTLGQLASDQKPDMPTVSDAAKDSTPVVKKMPKYSIVVRKVSGRRTLPSEDVRKEDIQISNPVVTSSPEKDQADEIRANQRQREPDEEHEYMPDETTVFPSVSSATNVISHMTQDMAKSHLNAEAHESDYPPVAEIPSIPAAQVSANRANTQISFAEAHESDYPPVAEIPSIPAAQVSANRANAQISFVIATPTSNNASPDFQSSEDNSNTRNGLPLKVQRFTLKRTNEKIVGTQVWAARKELPKRIATYQCGVCNQRYRQLDVLKDHMKGHIKMKTNILQSL